MAEVNDIDLKLNIIADDKASSVLKELDVVLTTLRESLVAFKDINPFAQLMDDAETLGMQVQDLTTEFENLREAAANVNDADVFATMAMQMDDAYQQGRMFAEVLASIEDRLLTVNEGNVFGTLALEMDDASQQGSRLYGILASIQDSMSTVNGDNSFGTIALEIDDASQQASRFYELLASIQDSMSTVNGDNSFGTIALEIDDASQQASRFYELLASIQDSMSTVNGDTAFGTLAMQMDDAYQVGMRLDQLLTTLQDQMSGGSDLFAPWQTELSDVSSMVIDISGEIVTLGDDADAVNFARWGDSLPALLGDLTRAETQLATIQTTTQDIAVSMETMGTAGMGAGVLGGGGAGSAGGGKGMSGLLGGLRGASSMLSELPMKLMYGGMNAMMGYYGLQALANGTSGFAAIQQMKNLNNSTVNQAAQYQMMLGAAGLTGTSGVSFLQGLAGNMQKTFTPAVGSGALSQSAILLQSLGITQQDITQSPMALLNTIGQQYRQLLGQGRGNQASELLSLTGTSQVASLLQNWKSMQSQASQTQLDMSPQQLNQAVSKNVSMQMSMQQLNLAFEQMAITLVPLVTRLTGALTALMNGFTNGKGPVNGFVSGITGAAKHLGVLGTSIVGAIAAMKAISFTTDVMSGMGLLADLGGGMTIGKLLGKGIGGIFKFGKGLFGKLGLGGAAAADGGAEAGFATAGAGMEATGGTLDATILGAPIGVILNILGLVSIGLAVLWGHFKQVGHFFVSTGKDVGQWVSSMARGLGQMTSHLITWSGHQWSSVSGNFQAWTSSLVRWSSRQWTAVSGQFATWTSSLNTWAGRNWTAVSGQFSMWTSSLVGWASKLWTSVSGDFSRWTSSLVSWASKNWSSVSGDFSSWTSSLVSWSSKNWASVSGNFASWTSSLVSWSSKNWGSVSGNFSSWTNSLRTWSGALWGDVQSSFTQWTQRLGAWATNLWPAVQQPFTNFTTAITSWASTVVTDVENILSSMGNVGKQIVASTKNMFSGLGSWIQNSLGGMFGGKSSVPGSLSKSNASFVNTVRPYAQEVAKATGLPLNGIIGQWAYESGWGSSTAAQQNANLAGIIPFGQYGAGKDSSYAGFSNLAQFAQADISVLNESRYAGARSLAQNGGSIQEIYQLLSQEGYDTTNPGIYSNNVAGIANMIPQLAAGGMVNSPTLALVGEAGPEMVIPLNQYPVRAGAVSQLGATGTEGMPAGGSLAGPAGGQVFNVVINVNGAMGGMGAGTAEVRQMAEMVATEFKNQMKRRGNFDWG
ncbi:glucosaminidase domain-containing protein [Alicyclobacillus sp. ALC3]|uniref:glucosaminidase domain-containing protein n=1 Tax=Alicyclobacillus sp. ALC3 TaxID=2796143 RepID=UPI0023784012|nr:glucosaminidase domain-containing protein [Alicyclobacillus sp. ALC3]WDL96949.1 glucosaminidase domain-containing protein [Alicyclobacillus sp. ALC3]